MKFKEVCIEAFGYALPERIVTSQQIEEMLQPLYSRLGLCIGRLELMTGIRSRRFWKPGTLPSQSAAAAGEDAIAKAQIPRENIGCLINCSVSRDSVEPATSTAVHRLLALGRRVLNFDISNACLGMASGVLVLASMIELGQIDAGIAVCGENSAPLVRTTIDKLNTDQSVTRRSLKGQFASLTIGSAAAAVILRSRRTSRTGHRLSAAFSCTDTDSNGLCKGDAQGGMTDDAAPLMETDSHTLLKHGVATAADMWRGLKQAADWSNDTPDIVCTHQVGKAHSKLLFTTLGLDPAKDFVSYPELGNCGSASWPVTCALAEQNNAIKPDNALAILAIGSGINCTGLAVKW